MHIWKSKKWENTPEIINHCRTGLRLKIENSVNPEVRKACKNFAVWLRKEYEFPIRVPIYIKGSAKIKAFDGEFVVGTFFEPYSYLDEPYVRIATGDYLELKCEIGQYDALASILYTIAHELTHYYQWLNHIDRSTAFLERQAEQCARKVLDDYALTRETP